MQALLRTSPIRDQFSIAIFYDTGGCPTDSPSENICRPQPEGEKASRACAKRARHRAALTKPRDVAGRRAAEQLGEEGAVRMFFLTRIPFGNQTWQSKMMENG